MIAVSTWVSTSSNVELAPADRFVMDGFEVSSIVAWNGEMGHASGLHVNQDGRVGARVRRSPIRRSGMPAELLARLDEAAEQAILEAADKVVSS